MKKKINILSSFAIAFAAIGWVVENLSRLFSYGVLDSRFHFLPFIGAYGWIPFAFAAVGHPDNIGFFEHRMFKKQNEKTKFLSNLLYFVIICSAVFVGEVAVGTAYEKAAGVKLWDYSEEFLHFTDYTCLKSIVGFGLGAYAIAKFIFFPLYNRMLEKCSSRTMAPFKYTYAVIVADEIFMMIRIALTKTKVDYWSIQFSETSNLTAAAFFFILIVLTMTSLLLLANYDIGKLISKRDTLTNFIEENPVKDASDSSDETPQLPHEL